MGYSPDLGAGAVPVSAKLTRIHKTNRREDGDSFAASAAGRL